MSANRYGMAVWTTFGAAAVLNLLEAVADPDGDLWLALRVLAAAAFTAAVLAWVVEAVRTRRSPGARHGPG